MPNLEDSTGELRWWRERLEGTSDWNSLPNTTKERLLDTFKQCISALLYLNITKKELLKLIQLTDVATVFEAVLHTMSLPDLEYKDRYATLQYLKKVVINSELGRFNKAPVIHKERKPPKRRGRTASLEYIRENNPYNFSQRLRFCKVCDRRIRPDNVTGICTKCQHAGRMKDGS